MAGEVENYIIEESIPYFSKESNTYIQNILSEFITPIELWIAKANNFLMHNQEVKNKTFITDKGNAAGGVTWGGGSSSKNLLEGQLRAHAADIQSKRFSLIKQDFSGEYLLKEGYKLLTRLGEQLRKGKEVQYEIYVHSTGADLHISDMTKFKLNLDDFIDKASISTNGFELNLKTKNQMEQAGLSGIDITHSIFLDNLNVFIEQLKGYFLFAGKDKKHIFAGQAAKIKTINYGQIIEGLLNYPDGLTKVDLSEYRYAKGEAYWSQFDERAQSDFPKVLAMLQTLAKPSPFWQGGEGGKGEKLQDKQIKASGASVTNLRTLVRQMLRVRMITRGISSKIEGIVGQETVKYLSGKDYTQEIYEGIGRMFDRDFKRTTINISL